MLFENIIIFIQLCAVVLFFIGLIMVTYLQIKLSRKLNKSLITFIPVLLYPKNGLSKKEIKIRKIGGYLLLIGSIAAVLCSLDELF